MTYALSFIAKTYAKSPWSPLPVTTSHVSCTTNRVHGKSLGAAAGSRARGRPARPKPCVALNRIEESARALVLLRRCRFAGNKSEPSGGGDGGASRETKLDAKPAWEPVLDALLTDAGADEVRDEVRVTIEQHALLAGAFPKFGFEGSVGI